MNYKGECKKALIFFLGVLILSMTYNLFVVPNNFVIGGTSGMAVIVNYLFKIKPVVFIYIADITLLVVSYFWVDKEKTYRALVGSVLYPLLITFTTPIANAIIPFINIDNIIITIILTGSLLGLGFGLVYKTDFSTGGGDVIMNLMIKYLKMSEGKASLIMDIIIIILGGAILGFANVIYSSLIIVISTSLIDKILIGISESKMFFIHSNDNHKIRMYLLKKLNTGVTLFNTQGGWNKADREMLMVVVPTRDYYSVKEEILKIDPEAFFIVSDCYETNGGVKRKNLPFI
jgi:uncharacterized membrane-anchored protein YitT (DUF2179 family)